MFIFVFSSRFKGYGEQRSQRIYNTRSQNFAKHNKDWACKIMVSSAKHPMIQLLSRKIICFFILLSIPILLWVVGSEKVHFITFLAIGILAHLSLHWNAMKDFAGLFEIILLFLLLHYLLNELGIDNYFPADNFIVIILLYLFLIFLKKNNRNRLFLIKGKTTGILTVSIIFSVLSIVSLAIWFLLQHQNSHAKFMPDLPVMLLIPLGIGFSIINSIYEEGIFRSILLSHFAGQFGFAWAVVLQAAWFSFLHYQSGFPSGIIGIGLTFIFGVMMGFLVHRTKGLFVPVLIHALADFAIFLLILLRIKELV